MSTHFFQNYTYWLNFIIISVSKKHMNSFLPYESLLHINNLSIFILFISVRYLNLTPKALSPNIEIVLIIIFPKQKIKIFDVDTFSLHYSFFNVLLFFLHLSKTDIHIYFFHTPFLHLFLHELYLYIFFNFSLTKFLFYVTNLDFFKDKKKYIFYIFFIKISFFLLNQNISLYIWLNLYLYTKNEFYNQISFDRNNCNIMKIQSVLHYIIKTMACI